MSEKTPVYIKEVALVDFKCFRGEYKFPFVDENGNWYRWTVFLGNNNTGKTNLLKAIASLEPTIYQNRSTNGFFPLGFNTDLKISYQSAEYVMGLNIYPTLQNSNQNEAILNISKDINTNLWYTKNKDNFSAANGENHELIGNLSIYGYGVIRDIESKAIPTESRNILNADNLFNNTRLINFEDWLFQLDYAAKNNQVKAAQRRDLLIELLTSEIFPEINDIQFVSDDQLNNYVEFKTEDGWHRLSELGYGYQATLSWMVDFCKKLFDRYPESPNPLKEPAVILVDEIDLHLHPQWQRSIVRYLSNIFDKTQFIVTTHSPFILQSMEDVNLFTLKREGDHTNVTHHGKKSFIGWRIEELLSEIMGLEENITTDRYQTLMKQFTEAIEDDSYASAKSAYDELIEILNPQSYERKLLEIQLTQLTPDD